jgi:hypothetical protein
MYNTCMYIIVVNRGPARRSVFQILPLCRIFSTKIFGLHAQSINSAGMTPPFAKTATTKTDESVPFKGTCSKSGGLGHQQMHCPSAKYADKSIIAIKAAFIIAIKAVFFTVERVEEPPIEISVDKPLIILIIMIN